MAEESFLLVSLKENKAKKLAQVINNDTCRLILDFLSKKKDITESEIAKELNLPLSTVHYNLQQLVDNKLVQSEEFHYSEKGREVNHYKLSNKLIIIAPEGADEGLKEKIKAIWPLGLIALAASGIIHAFSSGFINRLFSLGKISFSTASFADSARLAAPAAEEAVAAGMAKGAEAASQLAETTAEAAPIIIQNIMPAQQTPIAFWFFLGSISMILCYVVYAWIMSRKKK